MIPNEKSSQMPVESTLAFESFLVLRIANLVIFQIKFEPLAYILAFHIFKSCTIFKIGNLG